MKAHLACFAILSVFPASTLALTVEVKVTPSYVKEHPDNFSVKVDKKSNGLINFTITRNVKHPSYLIATCKVFKDSALITQTVHTVFSTGDPESVDISVAPDLVAESVVELYDGSFGTDGTRKVPVPGSVNYMIRLKDFVENRPQAANP